MSCCMYLGCVALCLVVLRDVVLWFALLRCIALLCVLVFEHVCLVVCRIRLWFVLSFVGLIGGFVLSVVVLVLYWCCFVLWYALLDCV